MWGQIERFTKVSAKRATNVGSFLEVFKRKMACDTINPRWCETGIVSMLAFRNESGEIMVSGNEERREFLTDVLEGGEDEQIIYQLYKETARVILLVRDRLEREKPMEVKITEIVEGEEL